MDDSVIIEKDMAYDRRGIVAGLRRAFGDAIEIADDIVRVEIDNGRLTVAMGDESVRRIALIEIVHLPVTLTLNGLNADERADVLQRFDRAFQRGGG